MAAEKFTGAFDLLGKSYNLIVKNWQSFAVLYALPFLAALPSSANEPGEPAKVLWPLIVGVLLLAPLLIVLFAVIYTMLLQLELDVAEGKTPTLGQVWQKMAPRFWRLIGLMILFGLMVGVGLILLIIPGLFVIQRYLLAPYFLLDKNLTVGEAFRQSSAAAKKHSGALWGVVGVFILFSIVSSLPGLLGVAGFVLSALYSVAPAIRYLEVKAAS